MGKLVSLCFLLGSCLAVVAGNSSQSDFPDWAFRHDPWARILKKLYKRTEASIGFCFGSNPHKIYQLMEKSFAWPLPVTHAYAEGAEKDYETIDHITFPETRLPPHLDALNDQYSVLPSTENSLHRASSSICSNRTAISTHLCGPGSLELYLRFMLLTDNPEKVPATKHCAPGSSKPGCAPGFFGVKKSHKPKADNDDPSERAAAPAAKAHACCPGYFCPANLPCMMPCPLGSYCAQAIAKLPPKPFRAGSGFDGSAAPDGQPGLWCAPYAYRYRPSLGCGGADRWSIVPEEAFPGAKWDEGSGSLYCRPGMYCPNTTTVLPCPRGYFCRQGSTKPERCPPGAVCLPRTEVPIGNFGGVTADAALLGLLGVLWAASAHRRRVLQRLGPNERLKITWKKYGPRFTVVAARPRTLTEVEPTATVLPDCSNGTARTTTVDSQPANNGHIYRTLHWARSQPGSIISSLAPNGTHLQPIEIEFVNLSLRLKSCGRLVLCNVSARLRAARLAAIMGPSGAGKSSLLCALAGRAPYGEVTGLIRVNSRPSALNLYRKVSGFVPQEDVLYSSLTVEENLMFAARFRLPAGTPAEVHRRCVDEAVVALGLESVRREIVGNEANRGISGGQRKRVSIGLEIIFSPRLLLLDEPTSGLDAAGACDLLLTLQRLVGTHQMTAAAVVHQPRHEAFMLFDDVILLGRGGRTAYYGPVSELESYFLSLGHTFPAHTNPADALLDLVSAMPAVLCDAWAEHQGEQLQEGIIHHSINVQEDNTNGTAIPEMAWEQGSGADHDLCLRRAPSGVIYSRHLRKRTTTRDTFQPSSDSLPTVILGEASAEASSVFMRAKEAAILVVASAAGVLITIQDKVANAARWVLGQEPRPPPGTVYSLLTSEDILEKSELQQLPRSPGFFRQCLWCLQRAAILRSREPLQTFTDVAIIAATGTTVGILSDRGRATIMSYASSVSYSVVALGLMATVGSVPTFTSNAASYRREAASGLHRGAYFVALNVFDAAGSCVRAGAYLATWASFANPQGVLWQMYLVALGLYFACSGLGYILALALGPGSAQLGAAVTTLVATLVARRPGAGGVLAAIQQLSFARWALEGLVIAESNRLVGVWLLARCADLMALGYDVRRFWECLVALVGLGLGARAVALALLIMNTGTS